MNSLRCTRGLRGETRKLRAAPEKDWSDVAIVEVLRHVLCDYGLIGLKQFEVALPHLRGDLEADVKQLAQAAVVCGIRLIVAQSGGELLRGPRAHLIGRGKPGRIDVDDRGVGRAELFAVSKGLRVDLLGQREAVAAGFGQADQLFKPGGAGGLEVDARVRSA